MKIMFVLLALLGVFITPLSQAQTQKTQTVTIPSDWDVYQPEGVPTNMTVIPSELPLGSQEKLDNYNAKRINTISIVLQNVDPETGKKTILNNTLHTLPAEKKFKSAQEAIAYRNNVVQTLLLQIFESPKPRWFTNHISVELHAYLAEWYLEDPEHPKKYPVYQRSLIFKKTEFILNSNKQWGVADPIGQEEMLSNMDDGNYFLVQMPTNITEAIVINPAAWGFYNYSATQTDGTGFVNPTSFEINGRWVAVPYSLALKGQGTLRIILATGQKVNYDLSTGKRYEGFLPLETKFEVDGTVLSFHGSGEFSAPITIESSTDLKTWRPYAALKISKSGLWVADLVQPSGPRKFFRVRYKE